MDGIKLGDIITHVNDKQIIEYAESEFQYLSASTYRLKLKYSVYDIINDLSESVKLTIIQDGITKNKYVNKYDFNEFASNKTEKHWKLINNTIGYVNLEFLKQEELEEMMSQLSSCEAIIFDLRNYPKFIHLELGKYLNSEVREFAKMLKPDINYPGRYKWTKLNVGQQTKSAYKGNTIILVDERTLSRSEFICMSLQTADHPITIGNQSAGTDSDVTQFKIVNNYRVQFSSLGVYYPDFSVTQRKGVKIDYNVSPSIIGIRSGIDEVLQKAIQVVDLITEK